VKKVPSTKRKKSRSKLKNSAARIVSSLLFNKRAVSVALSTMIITAGVVAMGIAVLYWTYSWGKVANMQYSDSITAGSNAIEERIAFEYITYSSSNAEIRVNMINWGKANNVSIARVYIWDSAHQPVESSSDIVLMDITANTPISGNTLNIGDEGYFIVEVTSPLSSNSYYSIRVVTERGRNFDGSFATP
jgi:hypothetical protein